MKKTVVVAGVALVVVSMWYLRSSSPDELSPVQPLEVDEEIPTDRTQCRRSEPPSVVWPKSTHWDKVPNHCRRPQFYPSATCPSSCGRGSEPLYHTEFRWNFGNVVAESLENANDTTITNFFPPETGPDLVRGFLRLKRLLGERVPRGLRVMEEPTIHLTLLYACCLTKPEAQLVRAAIDEWQRNDTFVVDLGFERVECWHDSDEKVANILIADAASQRSLLAVYKDLEAFIAKRTGHHLLVQRSQQMPFHIPVAGYAVSDQQLNVSVTPYLGNISDIVASVNGFCPFASVANFLPTLAPKAICHANCRSSSPDLLDNLGTSSDDSGGIPPTLPRFRTTTRIRSVRRRR